MANFLMELICLIANQQKEDAETLLMKANISLFAQGNRWRCIGYLVETVNYDRIKSVEHACYLLSKLIERQMIQSDFQDIDYGGQDT